MSVRGVIAAHHLQRGGRENRRAGLAWGPLTDIITEVNSDE
jgi:hypothetical protein